MREVIQISSCLYNGLEQFLIQFQYSLRTKEFIKAFTGVFWSTSNRFWYLKDRNALPIFIRYLKSGRYEVSCKIEENHPVKNRKAAIRNLSLQKTNPITLAFSGYLEVLRYSHSTIATYTSSVQRFLEFLKEISLNYFGYIFDRNRLYGGMGYKLNDHVRLELVSMSQF